MPSENGTAYLVDPEGQTPETLSSEEFTDVKRLLDISRNDAQRALESAIGWLLYLSPGKEAAAMDAEKVFGSMVHHFLSDVFDDSGGVLANRLGKDIEILSDREIEILQWTLATIRKGGWFPSWLATQCATIADGTSRPEDRFPSPLKIAASLVDAINEHEAQMEAAREMVRMRPDLLFPAQPATPEPPAAPEPPAEPTAAPAKAQRARKPRKRAA